MDVMGWQPDEKPVTLKDLVRFEGVPTRLPPRVVGILTDLYRNQRMLGRALALSGEENGQKTLDIRLQLLQTRPHYSGYRMGPDLDEIYEGIEGAGSERLLIRAHIREIEGPEHRFLTLDESELLPTTGIEANAYGNDEEAWLLTTEEDVLGDHAEQLYDALGCWTEEHDERPKAQYLKMLRDGEMLHLQAIEMPLCCTLRQAQEFAGQLNEALRLDFVVSLAPRHAERRRLPGDVYETALDMARRLRGK